MKINKKRPGLAHFLKNNKFHHADWKTPHIVMLGSSSSIVPTRIIIVEHL